MAQNLETGLIINKLTGDTVGLNIQNSDALINNVTVGKGGGNRIDNTVLGYQSLLNNTTGDVTVSIGYQSLKNNTAGVSNISIGKESLFSNITASSNISIGTQSLYSNLGGGNTFNISIGTQSLYSTTGDSKYIISIGHYSLEKIKSGTNNISIGNSSLRNLLNGTNNISIGDSSLEQSTGNTYSVSIGNNSMYNSKNGDYNTSIGYNSQYNTTNSSYNTSLGYNAGNTDLGSNMGSYNTCLGYNSGPTGNFSGTTTIGQNSIASKDDTMVLGNPNDDKIIVSIGTNFPDDSAKLQIDSTTKGFLPPRMSAVQAEAITSPAEGLMVYINDQTGGSSITSKGWWGYSTSGWVKIGP